MKTCPVCQREVLSKRKDAIFCRDATCRKRAQQARKEQAAAVPPGHNKVSVVVTFPDGRRWLLELSPLDGEPYALPTLTQVDGGREGMAPQALPTTPSMPSSTVGPGLAPSTLPLESSEHSASPGPDTPPAIAPADLQATEGMSAEDHRRQVLRTLELFFIDAAGSLVRFGEAVRARPRRPPAVRSFAKAQLCLRDDDGYGLGGIPGRWPEAFPLHSPAEFGLEANVGVLYYDEDQDQVCVPSHDLLAAAFGPDWRSHLRSAAEPEPNNKSPVGTE